MISENLETIRMRIDRACKRAGRDPRSVMLVAVTKTFPATVVSDVVRAGVHDIGENYVQELLGKRAALSDEAIRWHFIGHLQTNKVRYIAEWITLIHAVDSVSLAAEVDRRAERAGRAIECLIEVNTTGESSKFGIASEHVVEFVKSLEGYASIRLAGLMTVGPFLPDPEGSRPMFRRLRQLRDASRTLGQANVTMEHLSMGMTGDFEVAIEEGATIIRLGTALFGPRARQR
jgi:pyridoxal phosphate enzyme (YggS family)